MGGRGPAPKPTNLRQRRNKKAGSSTLGLSEDEGETRIPSLLNPDKRKFHRLTRAWWKKVWTSPMASEYLETDIDGLARIALLVDEYYKHPIGKGAKEMMGEIRLQEARFGLSPVDRSRLQWEVLKGEEAERKRKPAQTAPPNPSAIDPRGILGVVK